jgi:hypothetical protein
MPISPSDWGGFKWLGKHITCYYVDIVFGRDLQRQQMLHDWIKLSAYMLPCGICENHFIQYQKNYPLPEIKEYEPGQTPYLRWSIRAHNSVRRRQRKSVVDEDVVVMTYKSGKIFGADTYIAAPKTRTSLESMANTNLATDPSGCTNVTTSELNGYKLATYILSSLVGLFLLLTLVYFGIRFFGSRRIPELSE